MSREFTKNGKVFPHNITEREGAVSDEREIERLRSEVDELTELLNDSIPKVVERLKLLSQVAQLRAELAATKTPGPGYLTAGDL